MQLTPGLAPTPATPPRSWRTRWSPTTRVLALSLVLGALAALAWTQVIHQAAPVERPVTISWWALTVLVFVAEVAVIHLRFGRDAHSFSLSEIVLVLGLFLAEPQSLLIAVGLGNALALGLVRRQSRLKLLFNVSQLLLISGVAAAVFSSLAGSDPMRPAGWFAAVLVAALTVVIGEAAIDTVIWLTGGSMTRRQLGEALLIGSVGASLNGALGLIAVFTLWFDPRAAWLALVPPSVMYLAYRTHASQREHHRRLESMHAVTEAIHTASEIGEALLDAADRTRELVGASWLEIVIYPEDERIPYQTVVGFDGARVTLLPSRAARPVPEWWKTVMDGHTALTIHGPASSALRGGPEAIKDAMLVPILGADRVHGYALAGDRLGDVTTFGAGDLQLLETVAKQISVSLDNGRLEHSLQSVTALKDRLEDMVESKDQFIAAVSHELRTPLTAVVGLANELEYGMNQLDPADVKEFIGLIAGQSNELAHIVEDLLVAARADIGTLVVSPEPVNVDLALPLLVDSLRFPGKSLSVEVAEGCREVWVDPVRFRQIVRNLLTNAARYGGSAVSIEVQRRGGQIAVSVIDNGPGVPEEKVDMIFEPYERGERIPSQPESIGLGLSVARALARLMDGDLVYERVDGLTYFSLLLPLPPASVQAAAS